jgi:hypothetical protein
MVNNGLSVRTIGLLRQQNYYNYKEDYKTDEDFVFNDKRKENYKSDLMKIMKIQTIAYVLIVSEFRISCLRMK